MRPYQVVRLSECPRCGEGAYETLRGHDHCVACNYSPNADDGTWQDVATIPPWALEASHIYLPSLLP